MAMSAEYRSKCVAPHRLWWRLKMSEKFLDGTKKPNNQIIYVNLFKDDFSSPNSVACEDVAN